MDQSIIHNRGQLNGAFPDVFYPLKEKVVSLLPVTVLQSETGPAGLPLTPAQQQTCTGEFHNNNNNNNN